MSTDGQTTTAKSVVDTRRLSFVEEVNAKFGGAVQALRTR